MAVVHTRRAHRSRRKIPNPSSPTADTIRHGMPAATTAAADFRPSRQKPDAMRFPSLFRLPRAVVGIDHDVVMQAADHDGAGVG